MDFQKLESICIEIASYDCTIQYGIPFRATVSQISVKVQYTYNQVISGVTIYYRVLTSSDFRCMPYFNIFSTKDHYWAYMKETQQGNPFLFGIQVFDLVVPTKDSGVFRVSQLNPKAYWMFSCLITSANWP